MTYKELQNQLKYLKAQGFTNIALNSSKKVLEAEYDKLTATDTAKEIKEVEAQLRWAENMAKVY